MFIKFGDKTKKIIVKNSKEEIDDVDNQEENTVYLDSDDKKDRRICSRLDKLITQGDSLGGQKIESPQTSCDQI